MNQIWLAAAGVALLWNANPANAQATTENQLLGTWKVVRLKATVGNNVSYPLGEHVAGYVTITPDRIWLLFVDGTRKPPASPALTDAESIAAMKSQVAWTGKYVTSEQFSDGLKLTAHVDAASSEAINHTDRVYFMRVNGNTLTVKSPGVIVPMTGATSIVEFVMEKAN